MKDFHTTNSFHFGTRILFVCLFVFHIQIQETAAWCLEDADCLNDGICKSNLDFTEHPEAAAGQCVCTPGFWGDICDLKCPIKCQNGGQCQLLRDEHGGLEQEFDCKCPSGFSGSLCATKNKGEQEQAQEAPSTTATATSSSVTSIPPIAVALIALIAAGVFLAIIVGIKRHYARRLVAGKESDTVSPEDPTNKPEMEMDDLEDADVVSLPSVS